MNGLLLILAITVLNQSELLPNPSGVPNTFAQQPPVFPPTQPNSASELLPGGANSYNDANGCQIGWGIDPDDNRFAIYIHIAPEAIDEFARGPQGQELEARLPPDLPPSVVSRMEKIIVRISKAKPDRIIPTGLADSRATGFSSTPYVRTLGNPVTIDRNNEIIPTASPSTLPPVNNGPLPSTSNTAIGTNTNSGLNSNLSATYPQSNPSSFGSNPNNPGQTGSQFTSPTGSRDGFAPTSKLPDSMEFLRRNNVGNAPSVSNFAQGNVPTGYNNAQYNNNGVPQIASNPNGTLATGVSYPNDPNAPAYAANNQNPALNNGQYTGSQYANNQNNSPLNYGVQPQTTTPPYAGINPVSTTVPLVAQAPVPNYAGTALSTFVPRTVSNGAQLPNTSETAGADSTSNFARNVGLGFLLSVIANIYLGMWLHHLRSRYRSLLGSMRGLAPSDID